MAALTQQLGWFLNYTVMVSPYFEGYSYLEITGPPAPIVRQQNELMAAILAASMVTLILAVAMTSWTGWSAVQVKKELIGSVV